MKVPASNFDPTGWRYELESALEAPELAAFDTTEAPGPEAAAAAFRVALCLGYCRLFGVELPADIDGTLPAREAMAAAEELIAHINVLVQEARELPSRWDTAPPGTEQEYCADLLQACMDSWAAFLAISEAHEDCVIQREPEAQEFDRVLDRLLDALDHLDDTLREPEIISLLATLAGSALLENWRRMLGMPDRGFVPWWLDGTLERESQRIEAESLAAWRQLQALGKVPAPKRPADLPTPSTIQRHSAAAILDIPVVVALAAESADEGPPVPAILQWASPDGRWIAQLSCPRQVPAGGRLPLEFLDSAWQPAVDLCGQPVWLAGQQETIDAQARASFDVQSLQNALPAADQPLTLEVGKERTEWQAIQSE